MTVFVPVAKEKAGRGPRGHRGQQGERGERGQRGERGESPALPLEVIARMAQELEVVQRELRVQFTRISQIQSDLDTLRADLKKSPA